MKKMTITARVTLLCAVVTAFIAVAALAMMALGEQRMLAEYYKDTLISAGRLAADDITWDKNRPEIDRNLDEMPNIITAVYSPDGDLIYGRTQLEAPFSEGVRRIDADDAEWYVYDARVSAETGSYVWLRLYMAPETAGSLNGITLRLMRIIFPVLVVLAGLGGWLVARRAFSPVAVIIRTAEGIADGNDLKKRIGIAGVNDELYRMAKVFDEMLERLDQAFERERRFTADVSHELRTPVTAILTQSEFAISEAADDSDRVEALREINSRAAGMRELTRKLLTLSRMDAGRIIPESEATDLAEAVEIAAETFIEAAAERDITVHANAQGSCIVTGDQTMLTQAVMNLVENAIRYGRPGGNVWVNVMSEAEAVRVQVSDDGIGMDSEQTAKVFDRFYQADPSRKGESAGLGLSLTQRIVQLHSGTISVESEIGKGSVFTISIPKGGACE